MRLKNFISEAEKIHSQEKFARENFAGLNEIGAEIKNLADSEIEFRDELRQQRKSKKITSDEYHNQLDKFKANFDKRLETLVAVVSIKLSSSVGHALNGKSTKTLKDIVKFMDTYGIGDRVIHREMNRIAQTRHISDNNFLDLAAIVAAQINDIDFIKELEAFGKKNKNRENIFQNSFHFNYDNLSDMRYMTHIRDKHRIALEALVNGSEVVYKHFVGKEGLHDEYVMHFIKNKSSWVKSLTKDEVANVISIEPKFFEPILDNMPENLPDHIVDIFIF